MFLFRILFSLLMTINRLIMSMLTLIILAAVVVWWANQRTTSYAQPFLYDDVSAVPYTRVALIPGTAAYQVGGGDNPYFTHRIEAAAALYKARRVRVLIVSGDNANHSYNEPKAMQKALIARGVPKEHIVLDYAGFRTLDSVLRCRDVFGQQRVVFVSQPFQNERAVYIGRQHEMDIIGFNAQQPAADGLSFTLARELFARVKMMLDIHVLSTQPKFLGEQISLPR